MEIKTLEQYVLNELNEREEELRDTCAQFADLSVRYKELSEKYNKLMQVLHEEVEYRTSALGRTDGYYAFYVWPRSENYDYIDELFHAIRERVENDESKQGEEV